MAYQPKALDHIHARVLFNFKKLMFGENAAKDVSDDEPRVVAFINLWIDSLQGQPVPMEPNRQWEALKSWFSNFGFMLDALAAGGRLSISRTWHHPQGSVTFGFEFPLSQPHSVLIKELYMHADVMLAREYERWLTKNPVHAGVNPTSGVSGAHGVFDGQAIEVDIVAIRKGNDKGKDFYKAIGGEYTKFGIPLYEEAMTLAEINIAELTYGENPYRRKAMVKLNKEGKPLKVIAFV